MYFKIISSGAAAALAFGFTGFAHAQETAAPPAAEQAATPQIAPVTDAEVTKFVEANEDVSVIAKEMTAELESAETEEQAKVVQSDARQKMVAAVEANGLSATRFTEIAQLAQTDADTNQRVRAAMES